MWQFTISAQEEQLYTSAYSCILFILALSNLLCVKRENLKGDLEKVDPLCEIITKNRWQIEDTPIAMIKRKT